MKKEKEKEKEKKVLYTIEGFFKIQDKKGEEIKTSPTLLLNCGRTINMLIV